MENRRSSYSKRSGQKRYFDANSRSSSSRTRDVNGKGPAERRDRSSYHRRDEPQKTWPKDGQSKDKQRSFSKYRGKPSNKDGKPTRKKDWSKQKHVKLTSDLQITDGKFRGKLLETKSSAISQISARNTRETVFKILSRRVRSGRFLEICAGPGIIGIEAISRGAMIGSFVERSARMCSLIRKNLDTCRVKNGQGEIFEIEALPFLKQMRHRRRFWDMVYCSLPFDEDYTPYLKFFGNGITIRPHGMLLIEHSAEMQLPEQIGLLKRQRIITSDNISISFFERK